MPLKRTGLELSVERELAGPDGAPPRRVRLTARFEVEPGRSIAPEEIAQAARELSAEADAALGPASAESAAPPRPDRAIAELIDAYHPRQLELVDLLLEEGQVTAGEAAAMRAHLSRAAAPSPAAPRSAPPPPSPEGEPPIQDRPLAALPLANDRTPSVPRPVDQLIRDYHIESLKQAGAVRARRQISYDEYMALKRHFAGPDGPTAASGGSSA